MTAEISMFQKTTIEALSKLQTKVEDLKKKGTKSSKNMHTLMVDVDLIKKLMLARQRRWFVWM